MKRLLIICLIITLVISQIVSKESITKDIEGKVIDINGICQKISTDKNKEKLYIGSIIKEKDVILTGFSSHLTIQVEDLVIKLDPLSEIQLNTAIYHERRLRNIWTLDQGEISVKFDSLSYIDPKVIFNTRVNSILITGTEFTLNEKGVVKVEKGSVNVFMLNNWSKNDLINDNYQMDHLRSQEVHEGHIGGTKLPQFEFSQSQPKEPRPMEPKSFFEQSVPIIANPLDSPFPLPPPNNDNLPPPLDKQPFALPPAQDKQKAEKGLK